MATDPLREALGAEPPASVAALPAAVRQRLAEQVTAAKRRHHEEVEAAVDRALHGVPLPVRGAVRKALS